MHRTVFITLAFLVFASFQAASTNAQTNPLSLFDAFPQLSFNQPLFLTHSGDSTDRIFVVQKTGIVHVFPNDPAVTSTKTFLDISGRLFPPGHPDNGETGLLSLAFHPDYKTNGRLYLSYVDDRMVSVVSELLVSDNPDAADLSTERILLELQQPQRNHNGGHIAFGPDGFLYIAFGDGFSESARDGIEHGDPLGHGQNPATWFSSVLRIDVDRQQDSLAYGIPADNPFVGNQDGWKEEIYAYGFRNPWRFSFDRESGDLWLADVGDKKAEEIDLVQSGHNYGWNLKEATHCFEDVPCDTTQWAGLTDPIFEYLRDVGESITGGYVYRGTAHANLAGKYIYGDFDFRRIWILEYADSTVSSNDLLATAGGPISSFGEDELGELYIVDFDGTIWTFERPSSTSVDHRDDMTPSYFLSQNYPNPFESKTSIDFELTDAGQVSISVFDILGRRIRTLTHENYIPGKHQIEWDGLDDAGNRVAGGLYIYSMVTAGGRMNHTMVLLR